MRKTNIDDEIEHLLQEFDSLEDTHPDYLPPEIRTLQARVLATHARLEAILENHIFLQAMEDVGKLDLFRWKGKAPTIEKMFEQISFRLKLEIVEGLGRGINVKSLRRANTYRNEFAHPKGMDMRTKYSRATTEGRENTRNLLRCLKDALGAMNEYAAKEMLRDDGDPPGDTEPTI